jgi:ribosomal protein S18 acetylase RimI-like enzyme
MHVRLARETDHDVIWSIIEPVIAAGETFALPRDWSRAAALGYWLAPEHEVFVAELDGAVAGTCYLQPNKLGGGDHIANAGFATGAWAARRGVARAMGQAILDRARTRGFRGMQFNFVVSTNASAVHLWTRLGFETLCRLPEAFAHPRLGFVDAFVMFRRL